MCGAFRGHDQNRIAPVADLFSERVEIRKGRWLRVVHYKPQLSVSDSGFSRDDVQSVSSLNSVSSGNVVDDLEYNKIVVIFFVHGVGGSADLWYEQLKYFCKAGYEVVAPDLLGHGQSSAPRNAGAYEFSELSYDLINLFDRYHKKRNVLVGHSYGASFCCVIASERARLVSKMVLIAGGGPVPLVGNKSCDVFCLPTPVLSCIKPVFLNVYERRAYNSQKSRSIKKKVKAFSASPFVLKAVMAGQRWEEGDEAYHQELMLPALLIYGAQDKFVSLEEEQWMQEVIYSSTLEVIQDAGHMVMVESPLRVNWLIYSFLQRDATTRSLHCHSCDLSSKGSIHVTKSSDGNSTLNNVVTLQIVSEDLNEEATRHSSVITVGPFSRENDQGNARKGSQTSLTVPGGTGTERRHSGDNVEENDLSSKKQTNSRDNTTQQASISNVYHSDNSLAFVEQRTKGMAWKDGENVRVNSSASSFRSYFRSKLKHTEKMAVGFKSAPPSPVTSRTTDG